MENFQVGPLDRSVLYEQQRHISEQIWLGKEAGPLRCIPTPNHDTWEISDKMWELIRQAGLEQLAKIKKIELDHGLITALVERWRPETNTFHLNSGEATVTLEDVAYIYGLPIDGLPVNSKTFANTFSMVKICEGLLGLAPNMNYDCYGTQIKFTWLRDNFAEMPKNRPRDQDARRTRAFLFCLVAGQIFWTSSGTKAPAHILELFRHFEKRSWGTACLADLYRGLSKVAICQAKRKPVKTITGPLKLLQVWAYSRMTIGRPIRRRSDWDTDVEFPLILTWYNRLRSHHFQTKVEEARRRLDIMKIDGFNWQPYSDYENMSDYIDNADVPLFRSNTILICYWIVERHNPERVMKQFGLEQIVPPRFQRPFLRTKILPTGENKRERLRAVYFGVWNKRMDAITYGEDGDAGPHNEAYLKWYRSITRLRIGRPDGGNVQAGLSIISSQILKYTARLLASCDQAYALEGKSSDFLSFIDRVRSEVSQLNDACVAAFQTRNLDDSDAACLADSSLKVDMGDDVKEEIVKTSKKRIARGKRAVKLDDPIKAKRTKSAESPRRSKRLKGIYIKPPVDMKPTSPVKPITSEGASSPSSLSPRRSPHLFQSQLIPNSPIKVRVPNQPRTSISPFTSSPWSSTVSSSTPIPDRAKLGIGLSPFSKISSLIMNVKARYREPKPPMWMADYTTGAWMRNPQYKLTIEELEILTVFRNEFANKTGMAKLNEFCTPVTANNMDAVLRGAWMDNWTMHYWFELLKTQAPSSYFFECALSDWYVHNQTSEKLIESYFSQAFLESIADKDILFFPVWHQMHFFLLVGRVNERRWEYYNSMTRAGDYPFAENYLTWINDRFMQYGWNDPTVWTRHKMDCPMQSNSVDCGIFVMVYAQHIALGRAMLFGQSDMYYYRAKIVSDIYKDQFARWDVRRQLNPNNDSSGEEN